MIDHLAGIRTLRFAVEFTSAPCDKHPGKGRNTGTETIRHSHPFLLSATPTLL